MIKKLRFLIASGPTREPLDPVRYLSNYSTGTMGRCLVQAVKRKGHKVTSVECPSDAETALELQSRLKKFLPKHDVLIMASAVCDVRPLRLSGTKIKKDRLSSIKLTKNPDILAGLSKIKRADQIFIGFGLESENIFKNGFEKLRSKKLELIVIQQVKNNKTPFGEKPIEAFVLEKKRVLKKFKSVTKEKLAGFLVEEAGRLFSKHAGKSA